MGAVSITFWFAISASAGMKKKARISPKRDMAPATPKMTLQLVKVAMILPSKGAEVELTSRTVTEVVDEGMNIPIVFALTQLPRKNPTAVPRTVYLI